MDSPSFATDAADGRRTPPGGGGYAELLSGGVHVTGANPSLIAFATSPHSVTTSTRYVRAGAPAILVGDAGFRSP